MKKVVGLCFLLILCNGLLGQINVSASKIYVLYVGLDNQINLETNERIKAHPEPFFMIDLPIPPDNKSPSLI